MDARQLARAPIACVALLIFAAQGASASEDSTPSQLRRTGVEAFLPYSIGNVRGLDAGRIIGVYRWNGLPVLGQVRDATAATEQFHVLTGLAALEAGYVVPGGVVEREDKSPRNPDNSLSLGLYSQRVRDLIADYSHTSGAIGLRLNLSDERGEWSIPGTGGSTTYASAALTAAVTPDVQLTGSFEILRGREQGEQASIYLNGQAVPAAPRSRTLLGQTWDGTTSHDRVASLRMNWRLNEQWKIFAGVLRMDARYDDADFYGVLQPDGRYESRYGKDSGQRYLSDTLHAEADGRVIIAGMANRLRFGVSDTAHRAMSSGIRTAVLGLSPIETPTVFAPVALPPSGPQFEAQRLRDVSWFASDSVDINERWTVLAGLRGGRYRETGANVVAPGDETYLLKNFGLRFAATPRLTLYASRGEALEQGGTAPLAASNADRVLPSYISHQSEAGLRYALTERLGIEVALFDARRRYEYEDTSGLYRQDGTVVHRGVEFKAVGSAGGMRVYANLLAIDPRVRGASDPAVDGKLVVDSARVRGRFIVESSLPWEGWSAHTQLDANGPRMADAVNATQIAGYGILAIGVAYERRVRTGSLQLRLDIENLTDRDYWESVGGGYLWLGGPRALYARLALKM